MKFIEHMMLGSDGSPPNAAVLFSGAPFSRGEGVFETQGFLNDVRELKKESSAHHSAWLFIVRFAGARYLRRIADY